MNPIFNEYIGFLKNTSRTKIKDLTEGYFWLDHQIIKAFDKNGDLHKLYKIYVDNDLNVTVKKPKGYESISDFEIASWNDIVNMQRDRLYDLENKSINLINEVIQNKQDYTPEILTSGGKDSSVTMHLVRKAIPNCHAIFNNTSLDCMDTYQHIKTIDNCITINPKEGFYQWRKKSNFSPTRFARACCSIFKEGAMIDELDHETKYIFFLGMRNEESAKRNNYGDIWRNNKWSVNWEGCLPIREWTELDVWLYILMNKIDFNPKYKKGYARCGCAIVCPFYSKSVWVLDKYWYRKLYDRWQSILKEDFISNNKWLIMNCTLKEYISTAWTGGTYKNKPTEEVIKEFMEYNGLKDFNLAQQYFNKNCCECNKRIKDKNVLAMNMKLHGRQINRFYCKKCFKKLHNLSEDDWNSRLKSFKQSGCMLF